MLYSDVPRVLADSANAPTRKQVGVAQKDRCQGARKIAGAAWDPNALISANLKPVHKIKPVTTENAIQMIENDDPIFEI